MIERVKNLPEKQVQGTHYNYEDMIRRLKAYRTANNSEVADPSVQEFFKKYGIQKILEESCTQEADKASGAMRIYIERVNFLYLIFLVWETFQLYELRSFRRHEQQNEPLNGTKRKRQRCSPAGLKVINKK